MTLAEFFTVLIATYAAIVSTLSVIYQLREKQRTVKVSSYHGFLVYGEDLSDDTFFIEVANTGNVPVMVQTPSLVLPRNTKMVFPKYDGEHRFPHELEAGHSTRIWIPTGNVIESLKEKGYKGKLYVRACVSDTTGKITRSKKRHRINLNL